MVHITFDHYYRYDELTALLNAFAEEYPHLVKIESIGKSYEGRDVWVATVTNFETGNPEDKAALWVDGNIHATEVSPTTACFYLLNKLTSEYGSNDDVTRVLDTRTYYICPRVNPDGAEWALADKPKLIRSSTRPYPYDDEPLPQGLTTEDIDGDGRMLMMRMRDDNGQWKKHPDEPRLMVRRDPIEIGGEYYRILPEGSIEDYDGATISPKPIKENLDLNRNFPAHWRQESEQQGAGKYPTSEPEVRNIVDFIMQHNNICGALTYHTWSGVLLRPYGTKADDDMPAEDLWVYKKIGDKGTELTKYPSISVFHDFKYHPKEVITGVFDDWLYDHYGLYAWTVEIWSPQSQAGIEEYKYIDWYREHDIADDLKMLKWSDDVLEGKGYIEWYDYEHPQLGAVELGGWDMMYCWRNPPPALLEKEIAPFSDWMIWYGLIFPELEIYQVDVTPIGGDNYQVRMVVQNTGWLPSYISKQALEKKVVRGVIAEIDLPDTATLKTGKQREMLSQLEGRNGTASSATPWSISPSTSDRVKVEWIVHAPDGGEITLTARHDRAGKVSTTIELGN
ncbi:MAG: M14 family metallopeptidase [Phototrophicaceae bacterium]